MTSSPPSAAAPPSRAGFLASLVGKKVIMAVTGVILFLFVVGHLAGNLKVFQGPEHFNAYAEGLRTMGAPFFARGQVLWAVRIVLLLSLFLHIWAAVAVTRASWAARPISYHRLTPAETTYAARTMRWGGVIIFVYVVYHLLDLTFGAANPSFVPGDVYHNLVASFARWPVSVVYIVAVIVVGLHVDHGLWSAFQTLGLNRPPTFRWRRGVAVAIAAIITAGYVAIPLAVLTGKIR
jgi:succinate dehydrogenase / fumarate reductase cytochrome b subunit